MQTIGERLLDARQRRGVSIREAAEATKVRGDYLSAMENNQFESIPLADVYRRGFLKIYARFLRLDADRVVGDFNALLAARSPAGPRPRRAAAELMDTPGRPPEIRVEPEGLDEFSSGAIEVAARPDNRRKTILLLGSVSLAVLLTVGVIHLLSSPDSAPANAETPSLIVADEGGGEVVFSGSDATPIRLSVSRKGAAASEKPLIDQEIPSGKTVTLKVSGPIVVKANPVKNLRFKVNGAGLSWFPQGEQMGYGELTVSAKGR